MTIEQLMYFSEAAKYSSFSVAAEKNYISQATFSVAIRKLEKELDIELFYRNRTGVTLTENGKIILDKVHKILNQVHDIEGFSIGSSIKYKFSIAAIPSISEVIIPVMLNDILQDRTSALDLSITTVDNFSVYEQVMMGKVRLGVGLYNKMLLKNSLTFTRLFEDEHVLYVGPQSLLWDKEKITREDVLLHQYVAFGDEFLDEKKDWARDFFKDESPSVSLRCNNMNLLGEIISKGDYVALVPSFYAKKDKKILSGALRAKKIVDEIPTIECGFIESTQYKLNSRERILVEKWREVLSSYPFR